MRSNLKLTAFKKNHNKKIIARRLAADIAIEIHRAEAMLSHLPIDVASAIPEDKAKNMAADYERMGCVMSITREKEVERPEASPESAQQKEKVSPQTIPHDTFYGKFQHIPAAAAKTPVPKASAFPFQKDSFIVSLFKRDGVQFVAAVVLLITALFFVSRCPAVRRTIMDKKGSSIQKNKDSIIVATGSSEAENLQQQIAIKDSAISKLEDKLLDKLSTLEVEEVKDTLAVAYAEKGDIVVEPSSRIKFYKMAISFNENNQAAWEGLVDALLEEGRTEEAEEAAIEKRRRFLETDIMLEHVMNSRGPVVDSVVSIRNTLSFAYNTSAETKTDIEAEILLLQKQINSIRKYREITITAVDNKKGRISKKWRF